MNTNLNSNYLSIVNYYLTNCNDITVTISDEKSINKIKNDMKVVIVDSDLSVDNLPKNIRVLILPPEFNQELENLPNTLTHLLLFNFCYNKSLKFLPESLKTFVFFGKLNNSDLRLLPKLECILFGSEDNDITNLPKSLKYIDCLFRPVDIYETITNPIKFEIPDSVNLITFLTDHLENYKKLQEISNSFPFCEKYGRHLYYSKQKIEDITIKRYLNNF